MSLVNAKPHADFIHRLQSGDDRAWEQFVSEWSPRLYNYMRYNLPSMNDVDAVLSRTMHAIVESIYHFDDSMTFDAFIYSIAVREVGYFYHQRRHIGQLAILETMQRMGGTEPRTSDPIEFYETLAQLPDPSRQADGHRRGTPYRYRRWQALCAWLSHLLHLPAPTPELIP